MDNEASVAAPVRRIREEVRFWVGEAWLSLLTLLMTGVLAKGLGLADDALKPIKNPGYPEYALPIFIGIILLLFYMKYTRRVSYGLTEIAIAIIGFLLSIKQSTDHFENWTFTLSMATTAYIGIRGLDNVVAGAKAHYAKAM